MSIEMESNNGGDLFLEASNAIDNLYNIRDNFFTEKPDEKRAKLQQEYDICLGLLDSIPQEHRKSPIQRARYEYLQGKVLDVFADYKKEAEDHLSKAVKLNPSLVDAWLSLGDCFWKKGDLLSAKNCFVLALSKVGQDKKILCQLSMLERKMAQGSQNQAEAIEQSIRHAKLAIKLDVKYGDSWYNLGNAYLTSFFVSGAWDHSKLQLALKAYQNAEKDEKMKTNPDLYYNCAIVNRYLENYERALNRFEAAASIDPGLRALKEVQKMVNILDKIENSLKEQTKSKRLASHASSLSYASSLAAVSSNPSHKWMTIDLLNEGLNKEVAVSGKVLFFIKHDDVAPLYYVVCDVKQACFVLSLYGIRDTAVLFFSFILVYSPNGRWIKEGDEVSLLDTWFRRNDISWKGKAYQFSSIRVDFLQQVLVNGKALHASQAIGTSICAQHKQP
ncbi:Tetratricopeptide repeat protein 5-like protein [Drosera capensis]